MVTKRIDDICSIALLGIIVAVGGFAALVLSEAASASNHCTITGTNAPDVLNGTAGSDVLCGLGGDDVIHGRRGSDRILGGRGDDELAGGPEDDVVLGGPGDDDLAGGSGKDVLLGGEGLNSCHDKPPTGRLRSCGGRSISPGPEGTDTGEDPVERPIEIRSFPCLGPSCEPPPPPPDRDPPQFDGLRLFPPFVDTSSEPGTVELEVKCSDPSGIKSVVVTFYGPRKVWREVALEDLHDGQRFFKSLDVPQATELGEYGAGRVTLTDTAGNETTVDRAEVEEKGSQMSFQVFQGPDEEGPKLTGLSISPTSVGTGSGPASIELSMDATDELASVAHATAYVEFPNRSGPGTPDTGKPARLEKARSTSSFTSSTT